MWNNLLKTITGAAGQAVNKVQQYIAPRTSTTSTSSVSRANNPYLYSTGAYGSPSGRANTAPATRPTSGGGYSSPTGVTYGTSAPTSGGGGSSSSGGYTPSTFSSILDSIVRVGATPVYSAESSNVYKTPEKWYSNVMNTLGSAALKLNPVLNYQNQRAIASGQAHAGSWGGLADFGRTEELQKKIMGDRGLTDKGGSQLMGGWAIPNSTVNPLTSTGGIDPRTEALKQAELDKLKTDAAGLNTAKSSYGGGMGGLNSSISATEQATIDKLNAIEAERQAGNIDNETAIRLSNEEQQRANDELYNQLIAQAESEIPLVESEYNTNKSTLEGQVGTSALKQKAVKEQNKNVYGEVMKKIAGNKAIEQKNISDVYAAAGTSGGSDYLNAIAGSERVAGNNIANSERDLQMTNEKIDQSQRDFEMTIQDKIGQLTLNKERTLNEIRNNVSMTKAQKVAASREANAKLYQDLVALNNYKNQQNDAFASMKQQLVLNNANILNNTVAQGNLYTPTANTISAGTNPNVSGIGSRIRKNTKGETEIYDATLGRWVTLNESRIASGVAPRIV